MKIDSFRGDHAFLSNFWEVDIEYESETYRSVEHAYVAAKTTCPEERALVRATERAGAAKALGRHVRLRPGWNQMRLDVMRSLLRTKFRDPGLRQRLLATGDAELVEGNTWGDRFWGVYNGRGQNHLGRLLMELRAEIFAGAGE